MKKIAHVLDVEKGCGTMLILYVSALLQKFIPPCQMTGTFEIYIIAK